MVAFIFIALSLRNKNYLPAGLQLISMLAFIFFVNVGYRGNGLIFGNMFERMYLLLIPAGFAPFLLIGYPALQARVKLIVVALLLGVVMLKTNNIWKHSAYYTYRLQILDGLESKLHQRCAKVAINWNSLPPELDQWSTGMEDLIYTSAHGRGCIISDTSVIHGHPLDNEHFVLRLDEVMDRKELNPVYFSLDSTPYCFAGGIDVVAAKQ